MNFLLLKPFSVAKEAYVSPKILVEEKMLKKQARGIVVTSNSLNVMQIHSQALAMLQVKITRRILTQVEQKE
jgi:hypothetical protein